MAGESYMNYGSYHYETQQAGIIRSTEILSLIPTNGKQRRSSKKSRRRIQIFLADI
jgi:hypothetical protein